MYIPVEIVGIGGASAAAVKPGKTFPAFFFCIHIAALKGIPDIRPGNSCLYIAHTEIFISHKLMTGIKIPPGGHCKVLCAGAAAGKPLCHTGPSLQINHKMEEGKGISLFFPLCHFCRQDIVLF